MHVTADLWWWDSRHFGSWGARSRKELVDEKAGELVLANQF